MRVIGLCLSCFFQDNSGIRYYARSSSSTRTGTSRLILGADAVVEDSTVTTKAKKGTIQLYGGGDTSNTATITSSGFTGDRTLTLPDKNGTFALTTDIPTDDIYTVSGFVASNNIIKCTSSGYYYAFVPADVNKISSVVGFYASCSSPYTAQWQADITSSKLNVPLSRSYIVDGYINGTTRKQNCFVFKFGTSDPGTIGYQIMYSRIPFAITNPV